MFIGPVFTREVVTAPRRWRLYFARATYVSILFVLIATAWMVTAGGQVEHGVGEIARFGSTLFQFLAPLQLVVLLFFSGLAAAVSVAHEKDRRTLVLLLLTNLSNSELVLGKLLASLLKVLVVLAAAAPLFMLCRLFGGVSLEQIARVFAVTFVSLLAAGSLGSLLALWRDQTFQAVALTMLVLTFWIGLCELAAGGLFGDHWAQIPAESWADALSPWRAILAAAAPTADRVAMTVDPTESYLLFGLALTIALNGWAIARVRAWNHGVGGQRTASEEPSARRATRATAVPTEPVEASPIARAERVGTPTRAVWSNPILWREMRTWAYGRRVLVIRVAYWVLFIGAVSAAAAAVDQTNGTNLQTSAAAPISALIVISLGLINAQAVTAMTSERDRRALDLLLATDLTPREVIFGKLGGVLYNTKEMVLLPMLLGAYLRWLGVLDLEDVLFLCGGLAVLNAFVAMLGVHCGMAYGNSLTAILVSLGSVFFLLIGVWVCMQIMIAFRGDFNWQLLPFFGIVFGGGVGLYVALGARNPSTAIATASFACPFATFYAITSYQLGNTLAVFLMTIAAYGFTTLAMLVPAIAEFDVATGRTGGEEHAE